MIRSVCHTEPVTPAGHPDHQTHHAHQLVCTVHNVRVTYISATHPPPHPPPQLAVYPDTQAHQTHPFADIILLLVIVLDCIYTTHPPLPHHHHQRQVQDQELDHPHHHHHHQLRFIVHSL